MRIHRWISSITVLYFFLFLHQLTSSCGNKSHLYKTYRVMTYRSPLERSIQRAIGITEFLTRPFRPTSNDKSINDLNNYGFGKVLNKFKDRIHAIVPGTRWCGDGNVAVNDEDIGIFRRTDACCRQHDKCDFNIESGQTYGNLLNNGLFTRSLCKCDWLFYKCLKKAQNILADNIGIMYFNILSPQCIIYDYPVVSCVEYDGVRVIMKKCIKYEYDVSQPMTVQWIDNPNF